MPKSMFQDVVCPRGDSTRKWYTLPLSFIVHTVIVIVLVVVPLVAVDVLPMPRLMTAFVTAPQLPPAPPVAVRKTTSITPIVSNNPAAAPIVAPSGITPESGLIAEPEQPGIGTGVIDGLAGAAVVEPPPPPPPPPTRPVRVGGGIIPPTRIRDVLPVYPPIAQSARVQGDVIIEATIGPDGKVQDARSDLARFRCSTRRPSLRYAPGSTRRRC